MNATIPRELDRIVMKALELDPQTRYQSAGRHGRRPRADADRRPVLEPRAVEAAARALHARRRADRRRRGTEEPRPRPSAVTAARRRRSRADAGVGRRSRCAAYDARRTGSLDGAPAGRGVAAAAPAQGAAPLKVRAARGRSAARAIGGAVLACEHYVPDLAGAPPPPPPSPPNQITPAPARRCRRRRRSRPQAPAKKKSSRRSKARAASERGRAPRPRPRRRGAAPAPAAGPGAADKPQPLLVAALR